MQIQIPTSKEIAEEMKPIIQEIVKEIVKEFTKNFQSNESNPYITRTELCKILDINLATEHRWRKARKIKAYKICGRVYYLRSEIDELFKKSKI